MAEPTGEEMREFCRIQDEIEAEMELEVGAARAILPAWFVPRMMMDQWHFSLVMHSGVAIAIETIEAVHRDAGGGIWLDVVLLERGNGWFGNLEEMGLEVIAAPTSRRKASVNAGQIILALEIADT